jgi:hypothetical protein
VQALQVVSALQVPSALLVLLRLLVSSPKQAWRVFRFQVPARRAPS